MTIRKLLALAGSLVLMTMVLAACGDDDATETTAAPTTTAATTQTTAAPATTAATATTAAPGTTAAPATTAATGGGDVAEFEVVAQSLTFSLDEIKVQAGQPVKITINDQDTTSDDPHNFHVRAGDLNFFTNIQDAPNTQVLEFTIDTPGTYEFFCDTHPADMVGVLIVEG